MGKVERTALGEFARNGAAFVGSGFKKHDDDWDPVLIGEDVDGNRTPVALYGDPDQQAIAAIAGVELTDAVRAARVCSAWMTKPPEDGQPYKRGDWVLDPDHTEVLFVAVADADGVSGWWADIRRDPAKRKPPTLSPWQKADALLGLQIDPVREAICQRVAGR